VNRTSSSKLTRRMIVTTRHVARHIIFYFLDKEIKSSSEPTTDKEATPSLAEIAMLPLEQYPPGREVVEVAEILRAAASHPQVMTAHLCLQLQIVMVVNEDVEME